MKTREEIEALTDDERRVKTAEMCGWTKIRRSHKNYHDPSPTGIQSASSGWRVLPDYLNSLDAMAKAESLPAISRLADEWVEALRVVSAAKDGLPREVMDGESIAQTVKFILRLSAKERNTAFLMTLLP